MAILTNYRSLNMFQTRVDINGATPRMPGVFDLHDGTVVHRLTGFFRYDPTFPEVADGTVTGYDMRVDGTLVFTLRDIAEDASYAIYQFAGGDLTKLMSVIFMGADRLNGSGAADTLLGMDGNDTILGNGGDDLLLGMAGNDRLYGGAGDDIMDGGSGNDRIDGGSGMDMVFFVGTGPATVSLMTTGAQATGYGTDTLIGIEGLHGGDGHDRLTGSTGANWLAGGKGNDQLNGLEGSDTLRGGAGRDSLSGSVGDDTLDGGAGDDLLNGGAGRDTAFFMAGAPVRVHLGLTSAQDTGEGRDRLIGIEDVVTGAGADQVTGHAGANWLGSRGGNDTLRGGSGADTLIGGAGSDRLYGGVDTARDIFVFDKTSDSRPGSARDVVSDFRAGVDDIVLRDIDAHLTRAGDQAFLFTGTRAAAHAVWYERITGGVIVHADVTGDARTDMDIRVMGANVLTATDFLL